MAVYFKCPKCGKVWIDMYGELARYDTEECFVHGPYACPECDADLNGITREEYYKEKGDC